MALAPTNQNTSGARGLSRPLVFFAVTAATLVVAGCRQDMHNEPKFFPQRGTSFYADGRSARPQVENTVARGQLRDETYFSTRDASGRDIDAMPYPVTMAVLERGQERYNIYCSPCHSRVGNGAGMIVQRGYAKAGDFHEARLIQAPLGHFFAVMTNGYGAMPDYAAQLTPEDRWAVAAYIRALQLSQAAKPSDVPAGEQPRSLQSIAEGQGLPTNFGTDWGLPATAVVGTTTGGSFQMDLPVAARPALQEEAAPPTTGGATQPPPAANGTNSGSRTAAPAKKPAGAQK